MSAFISVSMVSGTLSWSLSSIAVAPSSCRFYTRNEEKTNKKKEKGHNRGRPLKCLVSRGCVTHSFMFFSPHQLLLFITQKNHKELFGVLDMLLRLCVCVCAHLQTLPLPYARPHNTLSVLSRKLGGSLGLVAGSYRAKTG